MQMRTFLPLLRVPLSVENMPVAGLKFRSAILPEVCQPGVCIATNIQIILKKKPVPFVKNYMVLPM